MGLPEFIFSCVKGIKKNLKTYLHIAQKHNENGRNLVEPISGKIPAFL
jgi:hypothetical protein